MNGREIQTVRRGLEAPSRSFTGFRLLAEPCSVPVQHLGGNNGGAEPRRRTRSPQNSWLCVLSASLPPELERTESHHSTDGLANG